MQVTFTVLIIIFSHVTYRIQSKPSTTPSQDVKDKKYYKQDMKTLTDKSNFLN